MVIPGHNLGNSQVSVNRTIGPTLVSFCSRSVLLSTLCGPSRVLDNFHPVEWCLRLDGDLERLRWKLFILVNLDLSEILQEQLWLLDKSALWERQTVVKMMTSFAFSCLCHHRGVSGYAGTPRFPAVEAHTEHRALVQPDGGSIIPPPPDPKPVIWLVSMGFRLRPRTLRLRF